MMNMMFGLVGAATVAAGSVVAACPVLSACGPHAAVANKANVQITKVLDVFMISEFHY
jgi:hypothetical protein